MENKRQKWIKAAETLAKDSFAIVTCPACEKGTLIVKDVPTLRLDEVERYLICDNCGKYTVLSRLKIVIP